MGDVMPTGDNHNKKKSHAIRQWKEKVVNTLQEKRELPLTTCPSCKKSSVVMADDIVTPVRITDNNNLGLGGTVYPQVMFVCTECGYTTYYNLQTLNVGRPIDDGDIDDQG